MAEVEQNNTDNGVSNGASGADVPPNNTLYVSNLNEKIKLEELKKALYYLFSSYGNILEIIARKTYKLRGQAWIIFEDIGAATRAHRELQNIDFYTKPLKINFAKSKSDVIAKMDGSFVSRPKRKTEEEKVPKHKLAKKKKEQAKQQQESQVKQETEVAPQEPPNKILFVQNIPAEATSQALQVLFAQYTGFKEVRLVQGKSGIAFVEYEDEFQSAAALAVLQGFKINPTNALKISFAKK